jgi:hypothetical protein
MGPRRNFEAMNVGRVAAPFPVEQSSSAHPRAAIPAIRLTRPQQPAWAAAEPSWLSRAFGAGFGATPRKRAVEMLRIAATQLANEVRNGRA